MNIEKEIIDEVYGSVWDSVRNYVSNSVVDSVSIAVSNSVMDSVYYSVYDSIKKHCQKSSDQLEYFLNHQIPQEFFDSVFCSMTHTMEYRVQREIISSMNSIIWRST